MQRRLGPDYRYVRDLLRDGYIGQLRSVRMHVSVEHFRARRKAALYFTVPRENGSGILQIFGGHFFDAVFTMLGHPTSISGLAVNQFKEVTLIETGETLPHDMADQVMVQGVFADGAVLSVHLEAGKRNNFGYRLDLTGSEGDLQITNTTAFGDAFNVIEGAQGDNQPMRVLPVPEQYNWLPASELGGSQLELANLYVAYARDVNEGTRLAPTFADALAMHRLVDSIEQSSNEGRRLALSTAQ